MGIYRQAINELYFGRTPEIEACFQQFCKFRRKYMTNEITKNVKVNTDPDLIEFNRLMEKTFGFGTFELHVINANTINAYTFGIGNVFYHEHPEKVLIRTKNGVKYNPKANLICITAIYTGFLFDDRFTDEEVFSAILHEVGHNFQISMVKSLKDLEIISGIITILNSLIINIAEMNIANLIKIPIELIMMRYRKIITSAELKFLRSHKTISSIVSWIEIFRYSIEAIIENVYKIMMGFIPFISLSKVIQTLPARLLSSIINIPNAITRVNYEYHADSFPVMYGFGPASSSCERKLSEYAPKGSIDDMIKNDKLLNNIYQINMLPVYVLIYTFDEHPTSLARMGAYVDYLEREIKEDDIDPKLKKKLLEDYKQVKASFDEAYNNAKNLDKSQRQVLFNAYQVWLYDKTGSDTKDWMKRLIDIQGEQKDAYNNTPSEIKNIEFK